MEEPIHVAPFPPTDFEAHIVASDFAKKCKKRNHGGTDSTKSFKKKL